MRFATFFGDGLSSIAVGASNIELYSYIDPEMTVTCNFPMSEGNLASLANVTGQDIPAACFRQGMYLHIRWNLP